MSISKFTDSILEKMDLWQQAFCLLSVVSAWGHCLLVALKGLV